LGGVWATICKTVCSMLWDGCLSLSCLSLSVTLVYCVQTVGWIKMKLGIEVSPGHIVLDGDPAPPPWRGHSLPIFGPCLLDLWPTSWMDQDITWYGDLGPGHIVLDGDPAPLKGHSSPLPLFGPCLLWPNCRPSQLLLSSYYWMRSQASEENVRRVIWQDLFNNCTGKRVLNLLEAVIWDLGRL